MTMKWQDTAFKGALARAKGLGSARSAVGDWIKLRVTAIANALLLIWFVSFLYQSIGMENDSFNALLAKPLNAVAMILFIVSACMHSALGAKEIAEDYIQNEYFKVFKLIGIYLFHFALGAASIFAVLKIAL